MVYFPLLSYWFSYFIWMLIQKGVSVGVSCFHQHKIYGKIKVNISFYRFLFSVSGE